MQSTSDDKKKKNYKRAKTPTVIQMEAAECGAAALSIVASYYGKHVSLEEMRMLCGTSRDGSNALNIINAAHKLDFDAVGRKAEILDLYHMEPPFIIFWNFNHFLVVEGLKKNKVYLNDPAIGKRTVSYEEFDTAFTGIVITLQPGENFIKSGSPPNLFDDLKKHLEGNTKAFLYLLLSGLSLIIPGIAIAVFTQLFLDYLFPQRGFTSLGPFFFGIIATMLLSGLLTWLQRYCLNRLNGKLSLKFSSQFFWHLLHLPIKFYVDRYPAELANRLQINDNIAQSLAGELGTTIINLFLVIIYTFVMFQMNIFITFAAIGAAAINVVMLVFINRLRKDSYIRLKQDTGKSMGLAAGALRNIETIKSAGMESDFSKKWAGYKAKAILAEQDIGIKDIILTTTPILMRFLTTAILLIIGSLEILNGKMSIGTLMALQVLVLTFLKPFSEFINLGQSIQELKSDFSRLNDILKSDIDPIIANQRKKKLQFKEQNYVKINGHLSLNSISFGYNPNNPPFIENFNLEIKPGYSVALVGPSGCGKTTIAKLVANLYQPWEGAIYYDGKTAFDVDRKVLVHSLATVDQNIFIFEGTIQDNITLWDPNISDEDIITAARDAYIHHDIIERESCYKALLTEGGRNLSGGQRQRIEIARALIKNPSILILDEATSALDSETENIIIKNIRQRGCASLVISHRLSTIRDCDEIIVLDQGKVIQRGSHDYLKKQQGIYRELIKLEGVPHDEG